MRKILAYSLLCLALFGGAARASSSEDITLLVVPARYTVLQVAFDIVPRFPAVLVSYQPGADQGRPLFYAWNGSKWLYISNEDFFNGNFVGADIARTIVVGDDNTPSELLEPLEWVPEMGRVESLMTGDLINGLGNIFDFTPEKWAWFAARYNLRLNDGSEETSTHSWYDGTFVKHKTEDGKVELLYISPEERAILQRGGSLRFIDLETGSEIPAPTEMTESIIDESSEILIEEQLVPLDAPGLDTFESYEIDDEEMVPPAPVD